MKIRRFIFFCIIFVLSIDATIFFSYQAGAFTTEPQPDPGTTTTANVKYVDSSITATGKITAENIAVLHFQSAGKLVSLPVKEGDHVKQGQKIAQLDTYALQKALEIEANAYETAKNSTSQTAEDKQSGYLEGHQRNTFDTTSHISYGNDITEAQAVTDAVKRLVDTSELAQNTAQINVQLANYAVQLATLTSPFDGIVTQEDVTVPGVNVTTSTDFTVADPGTLVFRADVPASAIDFVAIGNKATVAIDGRSDKITGKVIKIYPTKVTLSGGESVYSVDIQSNDLLTLGKFDQPGNAIIETNNENVTLVPAWTVLSGKYIWVYNNNNTLLRTIKTGAVHGNEIEVTGGLQPDDKVIIDPKSISAQKYPLL